MVATDGIGTREGVMYIVRSAICWSVTCFSSSNEVGGR